MLTVHCTWMNTYTMKYVDQTRVLYTSHIRHVNLLCVIQFAIVVSFSILDTPVQLVPQG